MCLNPAASAFPAACRGVSERMKNLVSSLGIGDPPVFPEDQSNPAASAFPAACRGVSERMMFKIPSLGIEDSPELAPKRFNSLIRQDMP